jgi:hypothetical protein
VYCGEEATLLALSYNQEDRWKGCSCQCTSSTECSLVSDLTEEEINPPNNNIESV